MARVDTVLSPRELLDRMYERLRNAYGKVLSAQPGSVETDEQIVSELEALEALMQKLDISILRKLQSDTARNRGSFEKMQEMEKIVDDIINGKKEGIRKEHYIYRTAKRLKGFVKSEKSKTKRKGTIKLDQIRKEKEKLEKEKKEAQEMAGRKAA